MTSVVTDDGETIGLKEAIQRGVVDEETGCITGELTRFLSLVLM
jgi:hypothetical protein